MTVQPITPKDVVSVRLKQIPDYVIQAFNNLIAKNYTNGKSTFTKDEVIVEIKKEAASLGIDMTRQTIFDNKFLDIEPFFEEAGWVVVFDSPGYNESYPARFKFSVKKRI